MTKRMNQLARTDDMMRLKSQKIGPITLFLGGGVAAVLVVLIWAAISSSRASMLGHPVSVRRANPVPACAAADATVYIHISNQSFVTPIAKIGVGIYGSDGYHEMVERAFDVERQHSWHTFHYAVPSGELTFLAYEVSTGTCSSTSFKLREGDTVHLQVSYFEGKGLIPFNRPYLNIRIGSSTPNVL